MADATVRYTPFMIGEKSLCSASALTSFDLLAYRRHAVTAGQARLEASDIGSGHHEATPWIDTTPQFVA
jgi:hypothetical protein